MARTINPKIQKSKNPVFEPQVVEASTKKYEFKPGFVMNLGWGLLLIGGLAHMLPVQMEPLLKLSQFGVSVQMLVGVLSVLIALNFLLGDE